MKRGIVISAFGSKGYAYASYNLAYSIKYFNPDLDITFFCPDYMRDVLGLENRIFNRIMTLTDNDYMYNGQPSVLRLKRRIMELSPYHETLYLDADTVCISDMTPFFNEVCSYHFPFCIDVQGRGKFGEIIPYDVWAKHEDSFSFFSIPMENDFVATNSSWFFFRKGDQLDEIYGWMEHYERKYFPAEKLKSKWIKGMLPDELFFSGVISKLNLNVGKFKPMYFGNTYETASEVSNKHCFLSYYGTTQGHTLVKIQWLEYLERWMKNIHKERGDIYSHKIQYAYQDKALNKSR